MDFMFWLRMVILAIGAVLVVHGLSMVITGRLSERSRAAFRSARDAGLYSLFSGLGLVFLALGQLAADTDRYPIALTFGAVVLALTFMGVAVVRYRPRKSVSRR
ncbi:hypothetical protein [Actinoplanes sp. M2I2]|uniref:hypothetical protein n=1 Tax=Actinoplanes sp. M2I2 TaxID=1734444 RepID=UPI0020216EEF|nr:hypothetical protein [Actinoplanes sp. M2I2]